jgi:hypothetical protein
MRAMFLLTLVLALCLSLTPGCQRKCSEPSSKGSSLKVPPPGIPPDSSQAATVRQEPPLSSSALESAGPVIPLLGKAVQFGAGKGALGKAFGPDLKEEDGEPGVLVLKVPRDVEEKTGCAFVVDHDLITFILTKGQLTGLKISSGDACIFGPRIRALEEWLLRHLPAPRAAGGEATWALPTLRITDSYSSGETMGGAFRETRDLMFKYTPPASARLKGDFAESFIYPREPATPSKSLVLQTPASGSPLGKAILDALSVPVQKDLKQKVVFSPNKKDGLRVLGRWAYVYATLDQPDGKAVDYSKTQYQSFIDEGHFDDEINALLFNKTLPGGGEPAWTVRKYRIGCTDICWSTWSSDFGAPAGVLPQLEAAD